MPRHEATRPACDPMAPEELDLLAQALARLLAACWRARQPSDAEAAVDKTVAAEVRHSGARSSDHV